MENDNDSNDKSPVTPTEPPTPSDEMTNTLKKEARRQNGRSSRTELALNGLILVIAATISAGAALWGSHIGASGTKEAALEQQRQASIATQKFDLKNKRAEVYREYLKAATTYSRATFRLTEEIKNKRGNIQVDPSEPGTVKTWVEARDNYQDSVNQIYVYGSKDGWIAHKKMAAVLPPTVYELKIEDIDNSAFISAYQGFQAIFCREVNSIDNNGCV